MEDLGTVIWGTVIALGAISFVLAVRRSRHGDDRVLSHLETTHGFAIKQHGKDRFRASGTFAEVPFIIQVIRGTSARIAASLEQDARPPGTRVKGSHANDGLLLAGPEEYWEATFDAELRQKLDVLARYWDVSEVAGQLVLESRARGLFSDQEYLERTLATVATAVRAMTAPT